MQLKNEMKKFKNVNFSKRSDKSKKKECNKRQKKGFQFEKKEGSEKNILKIER